MRFLLGFGATFSLIGAVLIGGSVAFHWFHARRWERWPHVQATVSEIEYEPLRDGGKYCPRYSYRFGGEYIQASEASWGTYTGLKVGDPVTLAVDPAYPTYFEGSPDWWPVYAFFVLLGLPFLGFGLASLYQGVRQRQRIRHAPHEGSGRLDAGR